MTSCHMVIFEGKNIYFHDFVRKNLVFACIAVFVGVFFLQNLYDDRYH